MDPTSFELDVGGSKTTAVAYPSDNARATLVLAHGAGSRQSHPWMVSAARALSTRDVRVVTFDFLYSHAGRRLPDKNDVLEATWRAAVDAVRARPGAAGHPLFVGGKSMGGRIATQVAAAAGTPTADAIAGLVLLGYPLHPPGKPERLRAAHLPRVRAPMLFVQGSRDPFGTPEELAPIVGPLSPGSRLYVVAGGDHSLAIRREPPDVTLARVADEVARFCLEFR